MISRHQFPAIFACASALAAALASGACKDDAKTSETKASEHAEKLAVLADADVGEVRRGLPVGAKNLSTALGEEGKGGEPPRDAIKLRHTLDETRESVRDLELAKSTFFALTDPAGVVLRSDQDPDSIAGKNLFQSFPELSRAARGGSAPVETTGELRELRGANIGGDREWAAAVAVPAATDPSRVVALYVSGWSLRKFAYHLEETLRHDLNEAARKSASKVPLAYAFVFLGGKVYGAPVTPAVDSDAVEKLLPAANLANGATFHRQLEIEGRTFGVAARAVPALGKDAGVAVLRSET